METFITIFIDFIKLIFPFIIKTKFEIFVYNIEILEKDNYKLNVLEAEEYYETKHILFINYKLIATNRSILLKDIQIEVNFKNNEEKVVCTRFFEECNLYNFSKYSKRLVIPLIDSSFSCNMIKLNEEYEFSDTFKSEYIEVGSIKSLTFILIDNRNKKFKYTVESETYSNIKANILDKYLENTKYV